MNTKTAIVTGGNSGLGFATAKKLCDNGIKTYIIGRSKEKTEEACAAIGANAIPVLYDLNDIEGIPAMIENLTKTGSIDILVNNASSLVFFHVFYNGFANRKNT